jgi:hypothetical protein
MSKNTLWLFDLLTQVVIAAIMIAVVATVIMMVIGVWRFLVKK